MAFFKKQEKIINFVHVPKTGGTSIRALLKANDWVEMCELKTSNHDPLFVREKNLKIKDTRIDFEFTIVREPLNRFKSKISSYLSLFN